MTSLIDSLLVFASVQAAAVRPEPIDLAEVVARVLHRLEFQINERHATVVVQERWPAAVGHGPWVEEVWANYIVNALKHGNEAPRIELGGSAQDDGMVKLWVKDDGPGIPAEARARLFRTQSRATDRKVEGHGLGLSIVQRIVTKLGGQVAVESEAGKGSVFSFSLPAPAPAQDRRRQLASPRGRTTSS
jgi:signal transduction histidine kinase